MSPDPTEPEVPLDEATAYHESGHAIVAHLLGRPVHKVSVRGRAEELGHCAFGKPVFRPSEDWLEREILIAFAGLAAEARLTGNYAWDGAARDARYARELTLQRAGNERQAERLERRLLAKVEKLLADDAVWEAVEQVARDLLRRGEVSGRTVRHHFQQAQRGER